MDTIIFCSNWNNLPLSMEIRYEASPLFFEPIYIKNANWNLGAHDRMDCIQIAHLCESEGVRFSFARFSDDIWVYAPSCGTRGLYTLEEVVLPYLSKIETVFDCYAQIKRKHLSRASEAKFRPFRSASREFIDMALYCDDRGVFPLCLRRVNEAIRMYKDLVFMNPDSQALKKMLEHWQQQAKALSEDSQWEYLAALETRERMNLVRLGKLLKKEL